MSYALVPVVLMYDVTYLFNDAHEAYDAAYIDVTLSAALYERLRHNDLQIHKMRQCSGTGR